jgi:hypothetical protein
MYAESKVAARLAIAEREFGIHPEYHSVSDVEEFERNLIRDGKYILGEMGQPVGTTNLTEFDRAWMLNEQLLVLCDAAYFLTRYAYLRNEEGVIQRFKFRIPQRLYFDIICDLESRNAAIEIMALKARQLGVSIFTELLIAHRTIFSYGVASVIGSADQTKTSEMSRMLLLCYDMLPIWIRPQHTSRVESDRGKMLFGHMASGVSFQHGSQKFGIATGSTPTIYHLSEVALYGEASVMLIDEGLWKAVHASTHVLGILESTGRSNKGWWAETWYYSKAHWPRSRMFPMFLPWFCGVDIYPKPAWLAIRPIPSDWRPNQDTRLHIAKAELFVRANPLLHKHLLAEQDRRGIPHGPQWRMPLDQQWYWEINHDEAKEKGNESSFLQEMAGDDEEALQHSVESVFGHNTIRVIDERRTRAYTCYGLSGQSIEDAHEPPHDDIDYSAERIPVRMASPKGEVYKWELIPLTFSPPLRESVADDAVGKLIVFHPPAPNIRYSIGIDTSEGKGADSTVISVWGLGLAQQPDFQAAEFASPYVSHTEAYAWGACIGAYYAKYMSNESTRWPMPYCVVEQVAAVGDTCQLQMMRMGYPQRCFHKMTRYDGKPSDIARRRRAKGGKMGWFTWGWSRPILTGAFVQSAQNGWASINSPWLIEEMKEFEIHFTAAGKEKLEHSEEGHDDRIFAAAMATFCPHDMDILAERSKNRHVDTATTLLPVDIAPYSGHSIHANELRDTRTLTLNDIIYGDTSSLRRHSY